MSILFMYSFQEDKLKGKATEFRPNILMLGLSPSDFVLRAVSNVHTNDLEQTLLVRRFDKHLGFVQICLGFLVFFKPITFDCFSLFVNF